MYKTILVTLDGSKRSEAILPHVEEMALRYDAQTVFLQLGQPLGDHQAGKTPGYQFQVVYDKQLKNPRYAER